MKSFICDEEWEIVESLLPSHWQWQARKQGALRRMRAAKDFSRLFQLLMLHISGALSIEQTCVRARELGIARVTAMAFHKRLRKAGGWFAWMCAQIMQERQAGALLQGALEGRRLLAVDGTNITTPGAEGSGWRLHYALELPRLRCVHAQFSAQSQAETLEVFPIKAGDVVMADRNYARRKQLAWLIGRGADAIMRMSPTLLPVGAENDPQDIAFDWLKQLRKLKGPKPREWPVRFTHEGRSYKLRVCAVRKSAAAHRKCVEKIEAEARKKKHTVRPETLEYAKYVIVLTTLGVETLDTRGVLDTYRARWQVELAFKRLKSLLEAGSVPKSDEASALAWMQGKLLEALLVEKLLEKSGAFSPWGHDM
jgi:transposase